MNYFEGINAIREDRHNQQNQTTARQEPQKQMAYNGMRKVYEQN